MTRTCSKCGVTKWLESFHKDASCRGGRRPDCKDCVKVVRAKYLARNKDRISKRHRAYKYGLSAEALEELLARGCSICGTAAEVVDHDHGCCPGAYTCGRCIRGALCQPCNRGLGQFRDSPALLKAALDYLAQF